MSNKININKAREELNQMFIESLSEGIIPWEKEWNSTGFMNAYNAVTNIHYHGINQGILMFKSMIKNYTDPRWCTFNQAQEQQWHIKKGEVSTKIEYWYLWDNQEKKKLTFQEWKLLEEEDPEHAAQCNMRVQYHNVFNAQQIIGIPELVVEQKKTFELNEIVTTIIEQMNVNFQESGNRAFYRYSEDLVNVPNRNDFNSPEAFYATVLHELSHSTLHESRLNREDAKGNFFGSPGYAKEELRAEIAATYLSAELGLDLRDKNSMMKNHKAYIQGWLDALKHDSKYLFEAIGDANKISDYIIDKAGIQKVHELEKVNNNLVMDKEPISIKEKMLSMQLQANERNAELSLNKNMEELQR